MMFITIITFTASVVHSFPAQGCDRQILYGPSDFISSPGYPSEHNNHLSCTWTIKSPPNNYVTFSFSDVDIEENGDCEVPPCCKYTWLKIGSFRNKSFQLYCGRNLRPDPIVFWDQQVWIKYHAQTGAKGRGFLLKYSVDPQVSCGIREYRCHQGQCIPEYKFCNGHDDCGDNSDERNCSQTTTKHPPGLCPHNMTWCGDVDGNCFLDTQRCDRIFHCGNGMDEISCVNKCINRIQCANGNGCYEWKDRCNGIALCNDYSDEKLCTPDVCKSEHGAFLCNNLRCIRENWQCDDTNDCGDNSDEVNCIKNSVITAAVMGSLICGLLLVITIGCTCKLYALRVQDQQASRSISSSSLLEREIIHREPPPPYTMAINDPSAHFFQQAHVGLITSQCYSTRGISSRRIRRMRRHRRRPPTPPPQSFTPLQESNVCPTVASLAADGPCFTVGRHEAAEVHSSSSASLHSGVGATSQETTIGSCLHHLVALGKTKQTILSTNLHSLTLINPLNDSEESVSSEQCLEDDPSVSAQQQNSLDFD